MSPSEFIKWLSVFGVESSATGGGGGPYLPIAGGTMTGDLTLNSAPTTDLMAATKLYVDMATGGVVPAGSVTAATTANFDATYDNGASGVGATLTANSVGAVTFDGEVTALNEDYLIKNQTDATQNGVYVLTTLGDGATAAVFTRSTSYDQPVEIDSTRMIPVINGTDLAGTGWYQTNNVTAVGTDDLTFVKFGVTIPVPVGQGGTGVTSLPIAATSSAYAAWDSASNLRVNTLVCNVEEHSTPGTIVLTESSAGVQIFRTSGAFFVNLPDTGTLPVGWEVTIYNLLDTFTAVDIRDSTSASIIALGPDTSTNVRWTGTNWTWDYIVAESGYTGNYKMVRDTSPTFQEKITTPTAVVTGASVTNKLYEADSGTSVTLDPDDGADQIITLTGASPVAITLDTDPTGTQSRMFKVTLLQEAGGGVEVTWTNVTFASTGGVDPAVNLGANAATYFTFVGNATEGWVGYAADQNLGISDGSAIPAGVIGETVTSTVASGSAVGAGSGATVNVTSIVLSPGKWQVSANIGFNATGGATLTRCIGGVSGTSATLPTAPNGGNYVDISASTTAVTVLPTGTRYISISATATYYLVAQTTYGAGAASIFGSVTALRYA